MSELVLKCEFDDCSYVSEKSKIEICLRLLEMHMSAKHAPPKAVPKPKPSSSSVKPEKAKRPELSAEVSDEDWAYFLSRWGDYKKSTALEGEEIVLQLMECCCEQLRRDHHRTFSNGEEGTGTPTETERLAQLKQLAVRKKNRAVNRVKLGTLKQDKGEPVRKWAGRVRSLATVNEYSVVCKKCQGPVSYTDAVIMDQVITGLAESEIQKDVLSHPEAATMDLEKLLLFVEGKESGQASQGLLSGGGTGGAVHAVKTVKCKFCGSSHDRGKQFCKAADKKCDKCGKMNHLAAVCRSESSQENSNPKDRDKKAAWVKSASNAEHVDAAWGQGYPDSNWACEVSCGDDVKPPSWGSFNSHSQEPVNQTENKYPEFYQSFSLYREAGLYCAKDELDKNEVNIENTKEALSKDNNIFIKKSGSPPLLVTEKEAKIENKKAGQPTLSKLSMVEKEALKKNKKKAKKKAGQPTLGTNLTLSTVLTIMAGSAIMSVKTGDYASPAQAALVTQQGPTLGHHVYSKSRGWMKQAAKAKPMVLVQAKADIAAYMSLQIRPPQSATRVSEGYHLADTGASICLGGRQFMRSLGLQEGDLTQCDLSVCGADNANI